MSSGGKPPTPPNPAYVAGLQNQNVMDLQDWQNSQNRINYTTNTGSSSWDKTPIFDEQGYNKALAEWEKKYPAGGTYDPNALYLAENPDVAASLAGGGFGGDPRNHYREYGMQEGRTNFWDMTEDGRPNQPNRDDFTTYEWNATSSLNPEEQAIYNADVGIRGQIANSLNNNAANIFANAGPTDYSGVNPLQYSQYMDPNSIYQPRQSDRADLGRLQDPQMVGAFSGSAPVYGQSTGQYNIGRFSGGPQIRDWGTLMAGLGGGSAGAAGNALGTADTALGTAGRLGNFATQMNQTGGDMLNRGSAVGNWAGQIQPELNQYNRQMANMNPWEYDQQGADAMYNASMRYTQPAWDETRKMAEARLGEQGFVPGTPAYDNALKQMLDSQAMERDQIRDKSLLAGREFGNQAFDNRSGNLQNAIGNLLGLGGLGVEQGAAQDRGNLGYAQLGRDFSSLGLDALTNSGNLQLGAGDLQLGAGRLQNDADRTRLDAGRLGLDSDTARADQSLNTFNANRQAILDQFGIDIEQLGFNNQTQTQGLMDALDIAGFNADATGQNNAALSDAFKNYLSGVGVNQDATAADNTALSRQLQDAIDLYGYNDQAVNTNNAARTQGLTEADQIQQGDLNWLLSLLEQLGVAVPPEMMQANSGSLGAADLEGLFSQLFSGEMAGYNADVSSANANTSAMGSIAAAIAAAMISDRRLKTEISLSGKSPKGYPWYKFRYVWDQPGTVREGVMAQDILAAGGDGVITHPLGFYMVDYSKV